MDAAALTFHHIQGAERAFSDARDGDPRAPWLSEVAFVEVHHKRRVVIRGTVAGHYVDVESNGALEGRGTRSGAAAGAAIGLAFGPASFLAGLVVGSAFGSDREPDDVPKLEQGLTLVPLSLYFKDGHAKVELGVARGKRTYDKRQDLAKRDAAREMDRALKRRR